MCRCQFDIIFRAFYRNANRYPRPEPHGSTSRPHMISNASDPAPDYDSSDQLFESMYDSDHHRRTTGETSLPGQVNGEAFDRALSVDYGTGRRVATDDRMMAVSSRAGGQSYI